MRAYAVLVALLACAAAASAGGASSAASACDGVRCGMGTCKELLPPPITIPILWNVSSYECDCDPGWINFVPLAKFTACLIAVCNPLAFSCYIPAYKLPGLSNLTLHPCDGMNCGPGTCVEEPLRCQCDPGDANLLGDPSFPCVDKNCVIGKDGCSVPNPPPPPPPPPPSPASPGNDNHSSGPTPPSSTKGSVRMQNLLLLAFLAALHVVL